MTREIYRMLRGEDGQRLASSLKQSGLSASFDQLPPRYQNRGVKPIPNYRRTSATVLPRIKLDARPS